MCKVSRRGARLLFAISAFACLEISAPAQTSLHSVKVLASKNTVEIEIDASDRIVPQTQVLSGPDRLVLDFPNAIPGTQVRNQSVDRGEVKNIRVALFQKNPPIARVVLDLKSPRSYEIFPAGHTVIVKVMDRSAAAASDPSSPAISAAAPSAGAIGPEQSTAPLQVSYRDGLLSIHANKASLSDVLYAVQQETGAEISIAPGADQEQVVAEIGPAPASEVLARLLNGSKFNFLIMGGTNDPQQLSRVIHTSRGEMGLQPAESLSFESQVQAQAAAAASQPRVADAEAQANPPQMVGRPQPYLPPDTPPHVPEEDELNK